MDGSMTVTVETCLNVEASPIPSLASCSRIHSLISACDLLILDLSVFHVGYCDGVRAVDLGTVHQTFAGHQMNHDPARGWLQGLANELGDLQLHALKLGVHFPLLQGEQ